MTQDVKQDLRAQLPAQEQWPDLSAVDVLGYPSRLNVVNELLDRHLQGAANKIAIITEDARYTYAETAQSVGRRANLLRRSGICRGDVILLRIPNNFELVSWWLAVLRIGAVAVTTAPLLREKELSEMRVVSRPQLAIVDHRLEDEWLGVAEGTETWRIGVDGSSDLTAQLARESPVSAAEETSSDDIAILAFTSGSTGGAKATVHFHRDLLAIADTYAAEVLSPTDADIFIGSPPLAFTFGLGGLVIFPLRFGGSTVLLEKPSPDRLISAIAEFKPTILFTAPTAYRYMAAQIGEEASSSLRACVSAGEALPPHTFKAWQEATGLEILDGIGSTEMLHIFVSSRAGACVPGEVGTPVQGYQARVVDEEGKTLPAGVVGRLAVRGPTGCRYLNDTRQSTYVQDGWNITGDLFEMSPRGTFAYHGRSDDMIISSGYNVSAIDVEQALIQHEAVQEVAVVGVPDEERGQIITAFVVLREGVVASSALARELQDHVKRVIAPFKYPRRIEFVPDLPKTPTGKLQRHRLKFDALG